MKLEFNDNGIIYKFKFVKAPSHLNPKIILNYVDIIYENNAWMHLIKDDKLVLRLDHFYQVFKLSNNVINYINKLIKLKAFL